VPAHIDRLCKPTFTASARGAMRSVSTHTHKLEKPNFRASQTTRCPAASKAAPRGWLGPRCAAGLGSSCGEASRPFGAARTLPSVVYTPSVSIHASASTHPLVSTHSQCLQCPPSQELTFKASQTTKLPAASKAAPRGRPGPRCATG
jgi:hypothetical protein